MPHKVNHRGPAPEDEQLFTPQAVEEMRRAIDHLCWLLNRGCASHSALELVGNRFTLRERQRLVVGRCAATDEAIAGRRAHCLAPELWRTEELWLDGYNVLIALEVALGGGVVLLGRDDCCRDVLGIHGSYHRVEETESALQLVGELLHDCGVAACRWLLDRPVSIADGCGRSFWKSPPRRAGIGRWNWR